MKDSSVRIIGGQFKSRLIVFNTSIEELRPTGDRVRETLFNWLQCDIQNAICLDGFAGSGVFGLESISRGAKKVDFVDNDSKSIQYIKKNISNLNIENQCSCFCQNLEMYLNNYDIKDSKQYDIIFLDPPFNKGILIKTIKLIIDNNVLNDNGFIYFESEKLLNLDELKKISNIHKVKETGKIKYGLIN